LIKQTKYNFATLGKPHSLKGYLYINHEIFFRKFSFKNEKVYINEKEYIVEDLKPHLKNRYLVKFKTVDTIEKAEELRNNSVYIIDEKKDIYLFEGLPWPGFYVNKSLNKNYILNSYFYSENLIFCNIDKIKNLSIPYNKDFFSYTKGNLNLIREVN